MSIGERITKYMREEGINQTKLALLLDINRSYLSQVIGGLKPPSQNLIVKLAKVSGKSVNYWLHGKNEYDNLYSLNKLIDMFIDEGAIKPNGSYDDDIKDILFKMLNKEIKIKLENKKGQEK